MPTHDRIFLYMYTCKYLMYECKIYVYIHEKETIQDKTSLGNFIDAGAVSPLGRWMAATWRRRLVATCRTTFDALGVLLCYTHGRCNYNTDLGTCHRPTDFVKRS